jgi:uncharacterized protein
MGLLGATAKMRRRLLVGGLLSFAAFFLWAFWWEPASLRIIEQCVEVPKFQTPLRVAILTDLHVGSPFNGLSRLDEIVRRTASAEPDLVFVLGDLVIQGVLGGTFVPPEDIARKLGELRRQTPVYAVLGNHDNWLAPNRVKNALIGARIEVLEDRAVKVMASSGELWLVGVSDFWTAPHDVKAALAAVPDDGSAAVLMTHNPDIFPEIPARIDLTIAGHTHGGQVLLPLLGSPIVPSRYGQRFASGHIVENGRRLFVATGIGTSILPVRFRVPPAISLLRLAARC